MFVFTTAGAWLASCAGACACQGCMFVTRETFRKSARLAYSFLFVLSMIAAWLLRDFAKPVLDKLPWIIHDDTEHSDRWYGQQAVYRVSMGSFLFYGLLSLALIGVKYKSDKRDQYLHHGSWIIKTALWLVFMIVPFFLPNSIVLGYSWLARVGSGLFLIIQMLILLDCTQAWNDSWVSKEDERFLYGLLAISIGCYLGVAGIVAFMFYWFNPHTDGGCSLNVTIIALSILLVLAFTTISLSPRVQSGSLFPSAVISLYCMYLCYSALQSEPHDYVCNKLGHKLTAASGTTLAAGLVLTLLTTTYSAFRAGSNTSTFRTYNQDEAERPLIEQAQASDDEADEERGPTSAGLDGQPEMTRTPNTAGQSGKEERALDEFTPITYDYAFFHLIFALASMYIGMLMTGWGTGAEEKDLMDVGWASVFTKIGAQWFTGLLYMWMLLAPIFFPERDFA